MNLRERFHEVMNFNTSIKTVKWEFGYWGETIDNWYDQGLEKLHYPHIPNKATTPTSHLYSLAWNCMPKTRLPKGIAVTGGGLYWPTQGMPLDNDVRISNDLDKSQIMVNVNLLFYPMFKQEKIFEDENYFDYMDLDGVRRRFLKSDQTMASGMEYPIKDRKSWEKLKEERLNISNIEKRLPPHWNKLVRSYKHRDYPLALGGYPHGIFGTLANLMGYEKLFVTYYDDPDLIHDILKTFTDLWIAVYSEVLKYTDIDHVHYWEDVSYGAGSMISKDTIKEFMIPYYKKLNAFFKSKNINIILLDTDGDCMDLIPMFMESGMTGLYPMESHCGMDIVKIRKEFPKLQMMGGIPKSEITDKNNIDRILLPVKDVIKKGGYIPHGDHLIPPEINYANFKYYRQQLNQIIND